MDAITASHDGASSADPAFVRAAAPRKCRHCGMSGCTSSATREVAASI